MKSYSELVELKTFKERFDYLVLNGNIGAETFGFDRYLNQTLYNSKIWRQTRDIVIARDLGCDLGIAGYEINSKPIIHHMNPITKEQILNRDRIIFDPEFLITTTHDTHNAIHYGGDIPRNKILIERSPGDTKLW